MEIAPETLGGENLGFVEELYRRYLLDPAAVEPAWRAFFAPLAGEQRPGLREPAHEPRSIFAGNGNGNGHAPPRSRDALDASLRQARLDDLVQAYRAHGHMMATLDPLGRDSPPRPDLDPEYHGLGPADLDAPVTLPHLGTRPVRQVIEHMRATYCRNIGVQFMHVDEVEAREWLVQRMEASENSCELSRAERLEVLDWLTRAEVFEQFVQKKFLGAKRFSLEGAESLVPLLDLAIERGSEHGVEEIVIGMAHRGRLNVLVNVLQKAAGDIFREFEDKDPELYWGKGDVKYHLGHQTTLALGGGREVLVTLCFNPSHLEAVDPVVLGRVRARQDQVADEQRKRVLPILIHGDAAFAGQGVIQECLNMSELAGYGTGGALHVIVNNQIGFTTPPEKGRSTPYASDVAKMLQVPVFHVNGEHPESVVWAARLAMDFLARFRQDVIIDLYCYRRHGHNEGDEPSFTQPLLYEAIRGRPTVRQVYQEQLARSGFEKAEAEALARRSEQELEAELTRARSPEFKRLPPRVTSRWHAFMGGRDGSVADVATAVGRERLAALLEQTTTLPEGFTPHPRLTKIVLEPRREMARGERPLDWAAGELLAWATLVTEGHPVRLSGQDSGRGTFSHRHAIHFDAKTGKTWVPLCNLAMSQARFEVWDSPLSEFAVLGFEYGFSLDSPGTLVMWEAQFGDFANGGQVIIDQFITSAEDKWDLLSGLVLLLPHGFEGQGPEHSSARLERFLQLCAEDNLQVANPTTPAQLFHLLRRQVLRPWRKPLVVMSPKSLLRHKDAVSSLDELANGRFQRVIPDSGAEPARVKRVLLCSGKVYYELSEHRAAKQRADVALIRLEQLYPLPEAQLAKALEAYPEGTPVVWVQEEPWNMGAWTALRSLLGASKALAKHGFTCVAREASASPATGSKKAHEQEQAALVAQAFGEGSEA